MVDAAEIAKVMALRKIELACDSLLLTKYFI